MRALTLLIAGTTLASLAAAAPPQTVTESRQQVLAGAGARVLHGTVALPTEGVWTVAGTQAAGVPRRLHLLPPESVLRDLEGRRMGDVMRDRNIRRGQPVPPPEAPATTEGEARPDRTPYTLVALAGADTPARFEVRLVNTLTEAGATIDWSWKGAPDADGLIEDLGRARMAALAPYGRIGLTSTLSAWATAGGASFDGSDRRWRGAPEATLFGLFGGRPAVEETLQTQLLRATDDGAARTVDVATIQGVAVKSHPFADMLGNRSVRASALLDLVPADRLVVHVLKPSALLPFLNEGADFIGSLGGTATGKGVRYHLKDRYLARMGLNEDWLQRLLKAGIVQEMALVAPDLFFIDGTDITAVTRVSQPTILAGLLKLAGVPSLGAGDVAAVKTAGGDEVFWALRGDRLLVSTSRSELDRSLALAADPAAGLGRSAEFRYMLTQVPPRESTRFMVYLSDPFVRRLVGPQVKVGQLRRALARMRMEHVTSVALLASAAGQPRAAGIASLQQQGVLPKDFDTEGLRIGSDGVVASDTFGTLARPTALSAAPVTTVTPKEAEAYRAYLENYSRFWRQFFDPIAIRVDDTADGGLEMTTFILPLVDNSLYNGLREILAAGNGQPLNVPRFEPGPVLTLSLNLSEPAWGKVAEGMSELFRKFVHMSSAVMDDFGPAVHLAVFDADPVVALGSGDLLGAFGGDITRMGREEMVMIPLALSMLTRPCALAIETRNPERSARFLRQAASAAGGREGQGDREMAVAFYQVDGRNEWVYTVGVMGLIHLRFGIEISGRHLIIRNIPWSGSRTLAESDASPLCAARLAAAPGACIRQIPALHAAAMEKERQAAMQGAARLFPIAYALDLTADQALATHTTLYGFAPAHPAGGGWVGDARGISSSVFGSVNRQRQPAYVPKSAPTGLLREVERLNVSMQFEEGGLRSVLEWKTKK